MKILRTIKYDDKLSRLLRRNEVVYDYLIVVFWRILNIE